jgi:hypothetical protein
MPKQAHKTYHLSLHLTGRHPEIVAQVGAFADWLGITFAEQLATLRVSTDTHAEFFGGDATEKSEDPVVEVAIPVADLHPDTVAELNAYAEAQGQPALEGADAEVVEPVTSSTRTLGRQDVFNALRALLTEKGNTAALGALAKVGASRFTEVKDDKLADLFDAIEEASK